MTPVLGVVVLLGVIFVAMSEREATKLSYYDLHAAIVVLGGVLGSLLLAVERRALGKMLLTVREIFPARHSFLKDMIKTQAGITKMRSAWREGRRTEILTMAEEGSTKELRTAADALLRQLNHAALTETFASMRTMYVQKVLPVIEGWEMIGKLAPSFGMVGTVTGMVQLFRNMADNSGNLGGAMAMALLATLYGITLGAAVGGPMAARINNQLNDRLAQLDLLEKTVAALIEDNKAIQGAAT
jgi:flagellar motor component MotA